MTKRFRSVKRILSLLLILCFSLLALASCGSSTPNAADASGTLGAITWSYTREGKTLTLSGTGAMDNVTVSEDSDAPWADARLSAEKIVVNEGITAIGSYAFWGMNNVTTVTLPSTLTEIRDFAFAYCGKLNSVSFPAGLASIGKSAFEGCGSLGSVLLHETTKSVGDYAFAYCYGMKSAILTGVPAEGSLLIGSHAFENCRSLETLILRTSVTADHVAADAFLNAAKNFDSAIKTDNATGASVVTVREIMDGEEIFTDTVEISYNAQKVITPHKTFEGYAVEPLSVTVNGNGSNSEVVFTHTKIEAETQPTTEPTAPVETDAPDDNVNASSIIALVIMALVLIAIVVGAILLFRSDKKNASKNKNTKKK